MSSRSLIPFSELWRVSSLRSCLRSCLLLCLSLCLQLCFLLCFLLCFSLCLPAYVLGAGEAVSAQPEQKKYYDDLKRGWYWYEKAPEKPKEAKKEKERKERKEGKEGKEEKALARKLPSLKDYTTGELWNMHPDDFRKLLDDFHKKAIMKPTEENMYEYLMVYDIARRKALAVTNVQMAMIQKHPELNVGSDYPVAAPGRSAYTRETGREITDRIAGGRHDYGLVYFYADACGYCTEQGNILKYFIDRYGWETKKINVNESPRMASRFNVGNVPSLMLIYKGSDDYFPVSAGVVSLNDMEERIYRGMRLLAGETTMEDYSIYDFQRGGAFDTGRYKTKTGKP